MIEEILLLTDPALAADLKTILREANPNAAILRMDSLAGLQNHCRAPLENTRLLSFGAELIVPGPVLCNLGAGAYNFHPGPPTLPGRFPSCFFIYEGGTRFGSTVHEMAETVDSGPINAVDWFDVPPDIDRVTLNALSYRSLIGLFAKLAPHLATHSEPLPRIDATWSGKAKTQKDFDALCQLPPDVSEQEFLRRYRAVGEGPNHALEITLFGHRFRLDNRRPAPDVMVGGKKL